MISNTIFLQAPLQSKGDVLQHPVCTLLGLARAILNLMIEVQASQSKEHARTYHIMGFS